ncbi:MAG: response regulator [Sneathiella sp.]|nr:response regulator [Sneathiella sp.]
MERTEATDPKKNTENATSLLTWQKPVPYLFVGLILLFLYLKPEHFSPDGDYFVPRYLSFLTLMCGIILAGALIGFCRQKPNIFLLCLAHIFAGHALLQLQLTIWEFFESPNEHQSNTEQLHFLILPLFMSSSLFLLALMDRLERGLSIRSYEQMVYGAFGTSILIFSLFLHLTFGTPNVNISSDLVFTGSLISITLSFLALVLFPIKRKADIFSLRYWTIFLILGNLTIYLTPTELMSGLTKLNSIEVEFVRSGVFLTLIGGLIFHSVAIILTEQKQSERIKRSRAAAELSHLGSLMINKSDSFEGAAKSLINLISEREGYAAAHLMLLTQNKMRHYWHLEDPKQYQQFRISSENNEMAYGEGFLGSLWEDQRHGNISDLSMAEDMEYRRKKAAEEAGLSSVFAIPVLSSGRLIAMMEFFHKEISQPEHNQVSAITALCHQLGSLYQRQIREKRLTEREYLHQEVADRFPLAMAIFDSKEQLVFHNGPFKTLMIECCGDIQLDFDFTDMVTATAFSGQVASATDDPQSWIENATNCLNTPGSYMIWRMASGNQLEFSVKNMSGGRTLCLWTDVTTEQDALIQNDQTNNTLNAIFDTLPSGICIFDKNLQVTDFNSKFVSMLELGDGEIKRGINFGAFLKLFRDKQYQYAEFLSEMAELRIKMAEGRKPYHNEQMLFCQRTFNAYAAPTQEDGFTLTLMDMSEIESYQLELREAKSQAESSAEKAMELAQTAQSSNKIKSDFLTLIDRELRIPLNSISTANDLLKSTQISPEQSRHLKIIKSATEDLSNLMEDIQDLANLESQKLTLIPQPVHMGDLIDKLNSQWSFLAKSKSLDFRIKADPNIPALICLDGRRLEQIIGNLVDNALKYTRSGEIVVSIKLGRKSQKLNISVKDTGIGIAKEQQRNLFQSLEKAVASGDRNQDWSGLGLTLCYDLVKLMGGKIRVSSEPGEGSKFTFDVQYTLPTSDQEFDRNFETQIPDDEAWPNTSPTLTILVAEDHPVNQVVTQELLTKWGHQVEIVENGELAVAAVATCKFDLVIMDIHMPVMDGLQACKEIRAFPGRIKDIPIIALTANSMSGERQRCLKAGMNDYLTKPVHKWELKDTLLTYSNMKRVGEDTWKQKIAPRQRGPDRNNIPAMGAKVLDHQIFQEFIENFGLTVVRNLAEKLVDQYEINHTNVMNMLHENDWKGIGKEAHMIKSGFGQFGLMQAAAFATQMDMDAKRGNKLNVLDNAASMLNLCDEALIQLKQQLEALQPL